MEKSFSDKEIQRYIPNVVSYDELAGMNEQTFLSRLPMVILYLTSQDHGHWTLIHRVPGGIEFFDSYGYKPDQEFKFIDKNMQFPKFVAKLLSGIITRIPIAYNQYQFQQRAPGINTCGRWVIVRNMFSEVGIDDFKRGIDTVTKYLNIDPDELVVRITSY